MSESSFHELEKTLSESGVPAAFDKLADLLRAEKKYPQLFEALLMKKRHELGLPLEGTDSIRDLPEEVQEEVEQYYVDACRTIGELYLKDGDIIGSWPYFRAIDEPKMVAEAIEKWTPPEDSDDEDDLTKLDETVDIALNQGANPQRGYALVLEHYGVCRAITIFEHQFPYKGAVREECAKLLIDRLYADLLENVHNDVSERSEEAVECTDLRSLITDRDWLFDGLGYHIDISHLQSVVRVAATVTDGESLDKAIQMAEYGRKLGRDFQTSEPPPFTDFYNDYRIMLQAFAGKGVDGAVRYFGQIAERSSIDEEGRHLPGEVYVYLLYRVGRYDDAIDAYLRYLKDVQAQLTFAPSLAELCERSGDYSKLLEVATEKQDLLQFAAGLVKSAGVETAD